MNSRIWALLAALGATTIYALNHTIAKGVMPTYVQPFGFIQLRVTGAAILFWSFSIFLPKEKIDRSDWARLLVCTVFGAGINMLSFFKGLELSTPINSSVIITATPILVFTFSAFLLKEKASLRKKVGVVLGLIGALFLVLFGKEIRTDAPDIPLGNFLFVVNAASYGLYLILIRPLTQKYHLITVLKWLFLLGTFLNIPITYQEVAAISWPTLPVIEAILPIIYVVVGTTCMTYLLNMYALRILTASSVSIFAYVQPLLGILFAIWMGSDSLTFIKSVAAIIVCVGVYLVTKKDSK
jgi:drug/metabolite transporter (DMT)-like permease